MISLLFTLWIILVTIASLFLVGVPVTCLLYRKDDIDSSFWLYVPLLGFCSIILILQNGVYCNIPISWSTPFLWISIGIGWVYVWLYRRRIFRLLPLWALVSALAAYVVQAYGLLIIGADIYLGRAWLDQYNYISLSQFLIEQPYNVAPQTLAHKFYLLTGYVLRNDRIGQSVFQGFITASSFTNSQYTFEAVRLITPLLIAIAIALFCHKIHMPPRISAFTAFYIALLPGATLHHLEGFLSHALVSPLILALPLLVQDFIEQPGWRSWLRLSLIITTAISIYTEFTPLLVGVVVSGIAAELIFKRRKLIIGVLACSTLGSFLLLNPLYTPIILKILGRIETQNVLGVMYPWAYSLEGLVHIWFGEYRPTISLALQYLLNGLALICTVGAGYSWLRIWLRRRDSATTGVLALLGLALVLGVANRDHPYQFYKLLITVCPFLAFGICVALWQSATASDQSGMVAGRLRVVVLSRAVLFTLVVAAAAGIAGMIRTTIDASTPVATYGTLKTDRSRAAFFLSPERLALEQKLLQLHGQNLLIITNNADQYGGYNSGFINAWLSYFARYNNIWLTNLKYQTADLRNIPVAMPGIDYTMLPDDLYILTDRASSPIEASMEGLTPVWEIGAYQLSHVTGRRWTVTAHRQEFGSSTGNNTTIGPKTSSITFISGHPAILKFGGIFENVMTSSTASSKLLRVTTSQGIQQDFFVRGGYETISVPIALGSTTVTLQPLVSTSAISTTKGGTQETVINIRDFAWHTEVLPNIQASIVRIDNPNGLEKSKGESFFWLGEKRAEIRIVVDEDGFVDMNAEFILGQSAPNRAGVNLRITNGQGYQQDVTVLSGKHTIRIPVRAGTTAVSLTALDKPRTQQKPNNDPRVLMLGIKGIWLEFHSQS